MCYFPNIAQFEEEWDVHIYLIVFVDVLCPSQHLFSHSGIFFFVEQVLNIEDEV